MTEGLELGHEADVGAVRRRLTTLASEAGLAEGHTSDAALVATELASNVLKHAQHGGALVGSSPGSVAIAAWDRGPGMNVDACLRDGMSTAGTAGNGLGAIARLATQWDAYAPPGRGSVITAAIGARPSGRFEHGCVRLPYPGLDVCGDAWELHVAGDVATALGVDGLGHGDGAAEAAAAVIAAFRAGPDASPATILDRAHRAARSTRGAAATCVRIDLRSGTATVAGVGNVAAWIATPDRVRQLVTQHGTLGQAAPTLREESYPFVAGAHLVICSDGLKSRLSLADDPELLARAPLTIAAVLWRDLNRGRDDATVAVVRAAR